MDCPHCMKIDVKPQHPKLCGKNPDRPHCKKGAMHKQRKYERHSDKTAGKSLTPHDSSGMTPNISLPAEISKSKIISEIDLTGEFENMSEKFNSQKKEEDREKKYKYKCECGEYFNIPAEGNKCPFCGQ